MEALNKRVDDVEIHFQFEIDKFTNALENELGMDLEEGIGEDNLE